MATPAPELPANEARLSVEHRTHVSEERDAADPSVASGPQQRDRCLVAAGQGDAGAFAQLYDDVAPHILGLVVRILRDVQEAEVLTERIFLEIWHSAARFDSGRGAALSWMMTTAHRMCVEHVRSDVERGVRSAPGRHAIAGGGSHLPPIAPEALTYAAPHVTVLSGALADLEPTQRHALKLAYYNGHSHGEVGQLLRIPAAAAKTSLTRGLHGLRSSLSAATS
ncbi:sigma-70 family RNA polymerase sigma factor [Cryobacterium sp. PAMC25264]|uniref:sigma-70 family RNA polymerase sigma factor n=1 Tax=Cryobacterium sp. PAMC25264 TaxID=2861288 RepID=UPI001C6397C8|nr:sigma-70 family RNA polymerase sigma factor [Cryobacterium sp. PAMC25264]QYF72108.1 sigma-70 family RNA polymerase sigma factor [Cryobacterium sp. PAMC25264]